MELSTVEPEEIVVLGLLDQRQIFGWSGATPDIARDTSKVFDRVWHAGIHKLKSYRISGQIFGVILSFFSDRCFQVDLYGKCSKKYLVNTGILQGFIFGPALFLR